MVTNVILLDILSPIVLSAPGLTVFLVVASNMDLLGSISFRMSIFGFIIAPP